MENASHDRRAFRALLLVVSAGATLAATWQLRPLTPNAPAAADVDVVRGCEWLAWLLVGYLAIAVACTALAHLAGSKAGVEPALRRLTPGRIRDLVDLAMTVGVAASIVGSVAAVPAVAATPTSMSTMHAVTGAAATTVSTDLDWPGLGEPAGHLASTGRPPPQRLPPAQVGLVGGTRGRDLGAIVRPGDTLWTIAARHLPADASPAEISAAWHDWYTANRDLIGPDPALIHPGQHLTPPAPTRRTR